MTRCGVCGTTHDGAHKCQSLGNIGDIICNDCKVSFPESEINGHRCGPDYEQFQKEQSYIKLKEATRDEFVNHMAGIKHDQEKPDLSLLPREFLEETTKAFMHGEIKYGRYNYLGGMDWHRIISSVLRHVQAFNDGEDTDAESGCNHLGNAAAGLAMLIVYYKRGIGKDTRYKGPT